MARDKSLILNIQFEDLYWRGVRQGIVLWVRYGVRQGIMLWVPYGVRQGIMLWVRYGMRSGKAYCTPYRYGIL